MSIDLKPCPFCGGTDLFIEPRDFGTGARVICLGCSGSGPVFGSDEWLVPINDPDDRRRRTKRQAVKLAEGAAEKWQDRASQGAAPSVSATTQALIDMLVQRDAAGRAKYGTTLDRTDLSHADWLQHMAEELLDGAGYALAVKRTASQGAAAGVPEGWRLVPVEPTAAMIDAAANADPQRESVWAAYLAAAPSAPTQGAEREVGCD